MANLADILEKNKAKKPFKKKEVRSYSYMDDLDRPTNPPIDKPEQPAIGSTSDHVETTVTARQHHLPVQSEPVQPEPVQDAPLQSEPVQSEPIQPEPVQNEPVQNEPVQPEPVQLAPVQIEPVQPEPVQSEPVQMEPVQDARVHSEPVQSEPVLNEPVHSEPVQDVPVQSVPVQVDRVNPAYFRLNLQEAYRLIAELDEAELKIFLFLSLRAHGWDGKNRRVGDGSARASRDFIANAIGMSETTVGRTTPRLEKKGLIRKSRVSCKTGNIWQVVPALLSPVQSEPVQNEPVHNGLPSPSKLNGQKPFTRSKRTPNIDSRNADTEQPSAGSALWTFFSEKLGGKGITAVRNAKTNKQCLDLVETYGLEKCKQAVTRYVSDDDPYVVDASYDLGLMVSRLQRYLNQKGQARSGESTGHAKAWADAPGGSS